MRGSFRWLLLCFLVNFLGCALNFVVQHPHTIESLCLAGPCQVPSLLFRRFRLVSTLYSIGPPHRRISLDGNRESTRISSNDDDPQRAESPLTEVDWFGCAVQDDAHASAAHDTQEEASLKFTKAGMASSTCLQL